MGATDNKYTYELKIADGGPHRPDIADLGGADLRDKVGSPPQKGRDIYAGLVNEHGRNLAGLNRVGWTCGLWIEWDGAAWGVIHAAAMASDAWLTEESFTLTPGPTGTVTVAWDAGLLPTLQRKPIVEMTDGFERAYGLIDTATSIVVRIHDEAGSPTNANFVLWLG